MDTLKFISLRIQESTLSIRTAEKELQKMRKQRWRLIEMYMNLTEIKVTNQMTKLEQAANDLEGDIAMHPGVISEELVNGEHQNFELNLSVEKEDEEEETNTDFSLPSQLIERPATLKRGAPFDESDDSSDDHDEREVEVVKIESVDDIGINNDDPDKSMDFESSELESSESDVEIELVYTSHSPEPTSPTPSTSQQEVNCTRKKFCKGRAPTPKPEKKLVFDPKCSTGRSRLSRERKKWSMLPKHPEILSTIKKITCNECQVETFQGEKYWSCCARCFKNYVSPGCHQAGELYVCRECRKDKQHQQLEF